MFVKKLFIRLYIINKKGWKFRLCRKIGQFSVAAEAQNKTFELQSTSLDFGQPMDTNNFF